MKWALQIYNFTGHSIHSSSLGALQSDRYLNQHGQQQNYFHSVHFEIWEVFIVITDEDKSGLQSVKVSNGGQKIDPITFVPIFRNCRSYAGSSVKTNLSRGNAVEVLEIEGQQQTKRKEGVMVLLLPCSILITRRNSLKQGAPRHVCLVLINGSHAELCSQFVVLIPITISGKWLRKRYGTVQYLNAFCS